jgi:hypothetical protein
LKVTVPDPPVIPGAAAKAVAVSNIADAANATRSLVIENIFFMFVALMAALLIDPNFGHQSAEVLGVVRQVVKIGGIEVVHLARFVFRGVAGIQDQVE